MYRYEPHAGSPWVAEAVTRVLAFERRGIPIRPLVLPTDPNTRDSVLEAIAQHRVVEILSPHLEALGADPETVRVVRTWRTQLATAGLHLVLDTNAVSVLLTSNGIDHLVFKGVALAAMLGLDPTRRGAGDVDILVRPSDVARAEQVLHDAGWSRFGPTLPSPADGWRWKALLAATNELAQRSDVANPVDLHWRLTPFSGEKTPEFDDAFRHSVPAPGLADGVRTLCAADGLRHLAQHARKDVFSTLRHVVDVVRVADRCEPSELVTLANDDPNVALALAVAGELGVRDASKWRVDRRTRARAREAWGSCLSLRNSYSVRSRATGREALVVRGRYEWWMLRSAPSNAARLSDVAQLVVPRRWLVWPHPRPVL